MTITKYILDQIAEISCIDESLISISEPLGNVLDSLDQLELCHNIGEKYGIEIDPGSQLKKARTIAHFVYFVHDLVENKPADAYSEEHHDDFKL